MAHNSDKLPWEGLASAFELRRTNPCQHGANNLHARGTQRDSQTEVAKFVQTFMRRIAEDAAQQRKQYPEKYEAPDENEVIISNEAAARIEPAVRRWHPEEYWPDGDGDLETFKQPTTGKLCPHTDESAECGCVLAFRERRMSAFQRQQIQNDCYEFMKYKESFHNLEVVKTLILHGEMDPILRSCAYEECQLAKWWEHRECQCTSATLGWRRIYEYGIKMYFVLNILYCFPETWESDGSPIDDYRNMKAYQQAIRSSTECGHRSEIPTYPHLDFFGIETDQFRCYPQPFDVPRWRHIMTFDKWGFERYQRGLYWFDGSGDEADVKSGDDASTKLEKESSTGGDSEDDSSDDSEEEDPEEVRNRFHTLEFYPYGLMSYEDFLNFEKPMDFQPVPSDIPHVRWILCQKGLPVELSDCILEYADYAPRGSLPVPGKPSHPQCRQELDRYLEHCWQLIVRCYMLGHELNGRDGMNIDVFLLDEVKDCLVELFKCKCDGVLRGSSWL